MKRPLFITATIIGFLSVAAVANAQTNIDISNNSSSDVKVTTKNGQSTVCINGKCTTYYGNVNIRTEDGKTKVQINDSTDKNATNSPPANSEIERQREELKKQLDQAKAKQQELQEKIQKQQFDFRELIQKGIETFRSLFPFFPI